MSEQLRKIIPLASHISLVITLHKVVVVLVIIIKVQIHRLVLNSVPELTIAVVAISINTIIGWLSGQQASQPYQQPSSKRPQ
ncbi:hypothetical protein FPQ18DRAFT_14768 [Pyronema domesticum]|nr:hypothetical protein FPQ18DRAFT_14768 [Pyronema domesticum]